MLVGGLSIDTARGPRGGLYAFSAAVTGAVATSFLIPFNSSGTSDAIQRTIAVPVAGTLSNFLAHNGRIAGAGSLTYTLNVELVGTAVALVLATNTAIPTIDLTTRIAVAAGDRLSVEITNPAGGHSNQPYFTLRLD